jgi:hypothetical protein
MRHLDLAFVYGAFSKPSGLRHMSSSMCFSFLRAQDSREDCHTLCEGALEYSKDPSIASALPLEMTILPTPTPKLHKEPLHLCQRPTSLEGVLCCALK